MVHCKSCESYRLLMTALVGRDSPIELLSRLTIKFLKDFCHQLGLLLLLLLRHIACITIFI